MDAFESLVASPLGRGGYPNLANVLAELVKSGQQANAMQTMVKQAHLWSEKWLAS